MASTSRGAALRVGTRRRVVVVLAVIEHEVLDRQLHLVVPELLEHLRPCWLILPSSAVNGDDGLAFKFSSEYDIYNFYLVLICNRDFLF